MMLLIIKYVQKLEILKERLNVITFKITKKIYIILNK